MRPRPYLFHPDVPARCAACCPHTKLIILVRDPVARALSHYGHEVGLGYEPLPIEAAFAAEPDRLRLPRHTPDGAFAHRHCSYRARSRYSEQIEAWLAHFPARQIQVLQSEVLFAQPDEVGRTIREFLDLPESAEQRPLEHLNAGVPVKASAAFIAELRRELAGERERLQSCFARTGARSYSTTCGKTGEARRPVYFYSGRIHAGAGGRQGFRRSSTSMPFQRPCRKRHQKPTDRIMITKVSQAQAIRMPPFTT